MKIVKYPDPQLFKPCPPYIPFTFEGKELSDQGLSDCLDDMKKLMIENQGLGLAANQVDGWAALPPAMFVMMTTNGEFIDVINPSITSKDGLYSAPEGCLSLPGVVTQVTRSKSVVATYRDRTGLSVTRVFEGMDAKVFQHEYQHLQGVFFLDRISLRAKDKTLKAYRRLSK